jgi:hypothetical protein
VAAERQADVGVEQRRRQGDRREDDLAGVEGVEPLAGEVRDGGAGLGVAWWKDESGDGEEGDAEGSAWILLLSWFLIKLQRPLLLLPDDRQV